MNIIDNDSHTEDCTTQKQPPKNKKNTPERLERKKYNPYLHKVTVHREIK